MKTAFLLLTINLFALKGFAECGKDSIEVKYDCLGHSGSLLYSGDNRSYVEIGMGSTKYWLDFPQFSVFLLSKKYDVVKKEFTICAGTGTEIQVTSHYFAEISYHGRVTRKNYVDNSSPQIGDFLKGRLLNICKEVVSIYKFEKIAGAF